MQKGTEPFTVQMKMEISRNPEVIHMKSGSQSKKVIFKNNKPLIVPTGIFTDNLPYLMMLAMAAIGLTGFGRSRKRVKKSRDDD